MSQNENRVKQAVGQLFRMVRRNKEWTIPEGALLANISAGYLKEIEAGRKMPSLLIASQLCMAYDISLASLESACGMNN